MKGLVLVQAVRYTNFDDFISPRRLDKRTVLFTQTRHSRAPRPPTLTCLLELKCIQTLSLIHRLLESGNLPKFLLQLAGLLRPASGLIVFALGLVAAISCLFMSALIMLGLKGYPVPVAYSNPGRRLPLLFRAEHPMLWLPLARGTLGFAFDTAGLAPSPRCPRITRSCGACSGLAPRVAGLILDRLLLGGLLQSPALQFRAGLC